MKTNLVNPAPNARYDDIYIEGLEWINGLDMEGVTGQTLANKAMEMAGGDVLLATDTLEQWCQESNEVWRIVTTDLIKTACYDKCRSICRQERRQIYFMENYSVGGNGERVKEHHMSILDWPLPGGKRLRDATKADLIKASELYRSQARQMDNVANWLNKIADRLKRKTVGNTLSESEIIRFKQQTMAMPNL